MEKRKLVLTIIGVVILAMVIMVYIYFLKPGRDEKKNQQTINQVQTVQQKTDEKKRKYRKKIHPEMNWKMLRREAKNTGASSWIMFFILQKEGDIHYNVYIPDAYDGTKKLWDVCSISKNQNKPKG